MVNEKQLTYVLTFIDLSLDYVNQLILIGFYLKTFLHYRNKETIYEKLDGLFFNAQQPNPDKSQQAI